MLYAIPAHGWGCLSHSVEDRFLNQRPLLLMNSKTEPLPGQCDKQLQVFFCNHFCLGFESFLGLLPRMPEADLAVSKYWKIPEDLVIKVQKPHVVTHQPYFWLRPVSRLRTWRVPRVLVRLCPTSELTRNSVIIILTFYYFRDASTIAGSVILQHNVTFHWNARRCHQDPVRDSPRRFIACCRIVRNPDGAADSGLVKWIVFTVSLSARVMYGFLASLCRKGIESFSI